MAHFMHPVNIHVKHEYSRHDFATARLSRHNPDMNIANLRRMRGMNQDDLAELSGLSQSAISRAEAGSDGVTLRQYRAISEALKVPLAELFQEDRTKSENDLLEMFRKLPSERQALWLEMSRTFVRDQPSPKP